MKKNNLIFIGFWFLFLAGVGLRIYNLDRTLGAGDENQYLIDYGNTSLQYIATTFFYGGHHIFHTLIMRLMIIVFGDENAIAIRFPAFICGLATLLLVYKISQNIFKTKITPLVSLAIIVLCPIQIYYSNIARGYSFIIFFSALMILSALRIFESGRFGIWGWVLSISAFLSTYTIATNVYFVFGLGCWIALVVFVPSLFKETSFSANDHKKVVLMFLAIFISAGLMTLSAYWPVLGNMAQEAKSYHLPKTVESNVFLTTLKIVEKLFKITFQGNLKFFIPFIFLGIFWGNVSKRFFRILPLCVLGIPFLIPLATGVGGYARNYLFILPIAIPFLGEGLVAFGYWVEKKIRKHNWILKHGLVVIFFIVAISQTFWFYFPSSIKGFNLSFFKEDMKRLTDPLDLVIIADPMYYWYSHNIYKRNLNRAIFLNRMSGVKVIAKDKKSLIKFQIKDGFFNYPVFQILRFDSNIVPRNTRRGLSVFSLGERENIALFEKDFESKVHWQTIKGEGTVEIEKSAILAGNSSIKIINFKNDEVFYARGNMNRIIQTGKPKFLVMLWGGLDLNKKNGGYNLAAPTLILENTKTKENFALRMGKVNNGIESYIEQNTTAGTIKWMTASFIGVILPGWYDLKLQIVALEGQTSIFDGIRLFLFDVPS